LNVPKIATVLPRAFTSRRFIEPWMKAGSVTAAVTVTTVSVLALTGLGLTDVMQTVEEPGQEAALATGKANAKAIRLAKEAKTVIFFIVVLSWAL
jgi:hypothetical protein